MTEKTLKIRIKMHTPTDAPEATTQGAEEPEVNTESSRLAGGGSDKLHMGVVAMISGVVMLTLAFIFLNLRDRDEPPETTDLATTTGDLVTENPPDSRDHDKNAALLSVLEQESVDTTGDLDAAPVEPSTEAANNSTDSATMAASSQEDIVAINQSDTSSGLKDQPQIGQHAEAASKAPPDSPPAVPGEQQLDDAPAASAGEAAEPSTVARPQTSRNHSNQGDLTRTEPVAAPSTPAASANQADSPTPRIARAQFTNGIQGREPIDRVESVVQSDGQTNQQLYYFTDLRNLKGETVTHRWEHKGQQVAEVSFNVGGNRWRVFSSKSLPPDMTGEWQVIVTKSDGEPLKTASFVLQ